MKFRILPSGYFDLAEARDFYDPQSEGLGSYFLQALFHSCIMETLAQRIT